MNIDRAVVGGLIAVVAGCASAQRAPVASGGASRTDVVAAVYTCAGGPIMVLDGSGGPVLVDGGTGRVVVNRWHGSGVDHFLVFARVGVEQRPIAQEYLIPHDRASGATVRTYDRSGGAYFKITADRKAWRIRGEPSARSTCPVSAGTVAVNR